MFHSPHTSVEIPNLSVTDYLFAGITREERDLVAFIDPATGVATSYGELLQAIERIAGALAARGVSVGERIGIMCPNSAGFAMVFHGVLRIGAIVTTLNTMYTADEIEKQLRDAEATWIFTVATLLPEVALATAAVGIPVDHVVLLDGDGVHLTVADLLAEQATPPSVHFDSATHLAVLPYSSGTTAAPKGVMLTHRNLVANVAQCADVIDVGPGDRVLAVLPFFHIYGMTVLLNLALHHRATLVPMQKFDLPGFLQIVQDQECTFLFIAPPIAVALAKHPLVDDYDLTSVRAIFSGAAPLDGETGTAAARRVGARMYQGYGMSELSPVSHVIPQGRTDIPVSSIGTLIPNEEAKLVDLETGHEVTEVGADGFTIPGELWVRGPNVMLGYLNQPDSTALAIDNDGFLHTGDVATYHRSGYFSIVDRVKELIKYKGYQIPPAELEAILLSHPHILDAACIGVLDEDRQEMPKAFVVEVPGSGLSPAEVMSFVAERVAPYKKVRRVEFVEVIPKSASGKIMRRELRATEAARQS